jgi:hypothetical protein
MHRLSVPSPSSGPHKRLDAAQLFCHFLSLPEFTLTTTTTTHKLRATCPTTEKEIPTTEARLNPPTAGLPTTVPPTSNTNTNNHPTTALPTTSHPRTPPRTTALPTSGPPTSVLPPSAPPPPSTHPAPATRDHPTTAPRPLPPPVHPKSPHHPSPSAGSKNGSLVSGAHTSSRQQQAARSGRRPCRTPSMRGD